MLAVEPDIIENYVRPGRVRLVFRPVLNHGERSLRTSEAAFCAAQQDQFRPMHQLLFERQDALWGVEGAALRDLMGQYAAELQLDLPAFNACMDAGDMQALVQALDAEQRSRGITMQPVFEINGQRLVGFQSFDVFQRVIDAVE